MTETERADRAELAGGTLQTALRQLMDVLPVLLSAAEMHWNNDRHWAPVNGAAYFESNLGRDQNRRHLGQAIVRARDLLPALEPKL